jgi:hypothetical protein
VDLIWQNMREAKDMVTCNMMVGAEVKMHQWGVRAAMTHMTGQSMGTAHKLLLSKINRLERLQRGLAAKIQDAEENVDQETIDECIKAAEKQRADCEEATKEQRSNCWYYDPIGPLCDDTAQICHQRDFCTDSKENPPPRLEDYVDRTSGATARLNSMLVAGMKARITEKEPTLVRTTPEGKPRPLLSKTPPITYSNVCQ